MKQPWKSCHAMALATLIAVLTHGCCTSPTALLTPQVGPGSGSLVLVGGGQIPNEILDRFIDLAGGPEATIAVVPTAQSQDHFDSDGKALEMFRARGAQDVRLIHTRDPQVANSQDFVARIEEADAVWFTGGRQWRLADAYLDTRSEDAFHDVLKRGGVIGGTSAGATIQGSYLVRGAPEGHHIMMAPSHETGFGFLESVAIDQHLLARGRLLDLIPVVEEHPDLLGIGVDEGTALIVRRDIAEVLGDSKVFFYDIALKDTYGDLFYIGLSNGERYHLGKRKAMQ